LKDKKALFVALSKLTDEQCNETQKVLTLIKKIIQFQLKGLKQQIWLKLILSKN
jgi:hypothetical protein